MIPSLSFEYGANARFSAVFELEAEVRCVSVWNQSCFGGASAPRMRQVQESHGPFLELGVVWVRVCAVEKVLCKVGGSLLGREGFCLLLLHTLGCESCPACASP